MAIRIQSLLGLESKARRRKAEAVPDIAKEAKTRIPRALFDSTGLGDVPILESAFARWESGRHRKAEQRRRKAELESQIKERKKANSIAEQQLTVDKADEKVDASEAQQTKQDAVDERRRSRVEEAHNLKRDALESASADQEAQNHGILTGIRDELREIKGILRLNRASGENGSGGSGSGFGGILGMLGGGLLALLPGSLRRRLATISEKGLNKIGAKTLAKKVSTRIAGKAGKDAAVDLGEKEAGKVAGEIGEKEVAKIAGKDLLTHMGKFGLLVTAGIGLFKGAKTLIAKSGIDKISEHAVSSLAGKAEGMAASVTKGASGIIGSRISAVKSVGSKIFGKAAGEDTAKVAAEAGGKIAAKEGAKAIPILGQAVGVITGLASAANRAFEGDYRGAGMELGSGALNLVPGAGNYASIGADVGIAVRDAKHQKEIAKAYNGSLSDKLTTWMMKTFDHKGWQAAQDAIKPVTSAMLAAYRKSHGLKPLHSTPIVAAPSVSPIQMAVPDIKPSITRVPTVQIAPVTPPATITPTSSPSAPVGFNQLVPPSQSNVASSITSTSGSPLQYANLVTQSGGSNTPSSPMQNVLTVLTAIYNLASDKDAGFYVRMSKNPFDNSSLPVQKSSGSVGSASPSQGSESPSISHTPSAGSASRKPAGSSFTKLAGPVGNGLDALSAKYESRGSSAAIGYDSTGGASYGKYQISSKRGTMNEYLTFLKKENPKAYAALAPLEATAGRTNGAFASEWKKLANSGGLGNSEYDFIKKTQFDPAAQGILKNTGLDVSKHSKALQDALWSTAVQHGVGGAESIFNKLGNVNKMSDKQIIEALYKERGKHFQSSTPQVQASVLNRFKHEESDALAMLDQSPSQNINGVNASPSSMLASQTITASSKKGQPVVVPVPVQVASAGNSGSGRQMSPATGSGVSGPMVVRNTDSSVRRLTDNFMSGSSAMNS